VFEDIGRAFCIGLLDFCECNPISRIPLSVHKTLEGVKADLQVKNPIFIPKKPKDREKDATKKSFGVGKSAGPLPLRAIGSTSVQ
jgi:hypothetical protein